MLECSLQIQCFNPREEVQADLSGCFPVPRQTCVSVARAGILGNQEYFRPGLSTKWGEDGYDFFPETKGLSFTGKAVSARMVSPAPYATIYVSMLGENREFFSNYSDSAGRFFFSFPGYSGFRDLFVSTYHADYGDLELLIDRDFSTDVPQFPSYPVEVDDSLTLAITEMSVNAQVAKQYYPQFMKKRNRILPMGCCFMEAQ